MTSSVLMAIAVIVAGQGLAPADAWLTRLQDWTAAVSRHEIGTLDEAATLVAAWSIGDVQDLAVDIRLLVAMMRDESVDPNAFRLERRDGRGRVTNARWRFASREQTEVLRQLAHAESRRGDGNRLLGRGAMLHSDIAMLAPAVDQPAAARADPRPRRVKMYFADGRALDVVDTTPHWDIARALLDSVTPSPAQDRFVRLWYQATSAHQQREEDLDPGHLARALALFPTDPDILFFNGCLHESYASPAAHPALRKMSPPVGLRLDVGSANAELRQAESFFRHAVEHAPAFHEARMRLGRVLGLLGRHLEAAMMLRHALGSDDRLLEYYANLFLGAEEAALANTGAARAAYERAAALYPLAQSPHLGLSELALHSNDRAGALRAMDRVLTLPADKDEREDPWWTYHVAQGRTANERLDTLRRFLASKELR